MNLIKTITTCIFAATALLGNAQMQWYHIYSNDTRTETDGTDIYGKPVEHQYGVFYSYPVESIDSIRFFNKVNTDQFNRIRFHYKEDGKDTYKGLQMRSVKRIEIGPNVPAFYINTSNSALDEVPNKTNYLDGSLRIEGYGVADDFSGEVKVRGRGNSTWNMPKKAYRLKLPVKTKLCGYRKARNYVLLANYIDLSMMRNHAACVATQLAEMPFPTHATPVDVYFNNIYKGSYMLIEKVGINNGSVNMPAADEANSIMFELDVSYDEDLRVKTPGFKLPLMHKDPDAPADPTEAKTWFAKWADDFFEMEQAVISGNNIGDYIDYTTLAKYLLVYNLSCNQELNHPKSVYLYKTAGGKYQFGPCWDFDWAFGYSPTYRTEAGGNVSQEEGERMIAELRKYCEETFGQDAYFIQFTYNGDAMLWGGGNAFWIYSNGGYQQWPYGVKNYVPSYQNYLLGTGRNNSSVINGDQEMGNGGEFFMSIIMQNPEFMAEYKRVWDAFYAKRNEFFEAFDAYADMLRPSAERNHTVWEYNYTTPVDAEFAELADNTNEGAVKSLRLWLEKRIEFINDPARNYGLYDPATTYVRGTTTSKYY